MQIVLASSSPYRQRLLASLVPVFKSLNPEIDERPQAGETPSQLVQRLAQEKAAAVAAMAPNSLIIGSDQVASIDGEILNKPGNFARALAQLRLCNGRRVRFLTGLCVLNSLNNSCETVVETCDVSFRQLPDEELQRYLLLEQPYDCAGAIKAEGLGIALLESIRADDPNTLIGLPLIKLCELLRRQNYSPLLMHLGPG